MKKLFDTGDFAEVSENERLDIDPGHPDDYALGGTDDSDLSDVYNNPGEIVTLSDEE